MMKENDIICMIVINNLIHKINFSIFRISNNKIKLVIYTVEGINIIDSVRAKMPNTVEYIFYVICVLCMQN